MINFIIKLSASIFRLCDTNHRKYRSYWCIINIIFLKINTFLLPDIRIDNTKSVVRNQANEGPETELDEENGQSDIIYQRD